jgi:hypothetical protein
MDFYNNFCFIIERSGSILPTYRSGRPENLQHCEKRIYCSGQCCQIFGPPRSGSVSKRYGSGYFNENGMNNLDTDLDLAEVHRL